MFSVERFDQIVEMLKGEQVISVHNFARRLYVSEATVRRDLAELEKQGFVRRVYGGATLMKGNKDVPFSLRENEASAAKSEIGRQAAALVRENDVLFLDASSTACGMIPYLGDFHNLVVVTNGLKAAMALGERHIKTFLTGGEMIDNSYSLAGPHAMELIERINANHFFFSCRGVTLDGRITDSSVAETQIRIKMMQHAKRSIFLTASSKIGREFFYVMANSQRSGRNRMRVRTLLAKRGILTRKCFYFTFNLKLNFMGWSEGMQNSGCTGAPQLSSPPTPLRFRAISSTVRQEPCSSS